MTMLNPYIHFKAKAREAMEFYHSVFGGKLTISTFNDNHMAHTPTDGDLIMHAMLTTEDGLTLMGSDTPTDMEYQAGRNVSMSLSGEDEPELRGYWDKLANGAVVEMPLSKAPWGDTFGMLTDKFGIRWMVNVNAKKA